MGMTKHVGKDQGGARKAASGRRIASAFSATHAVVVCLFLSLVCFALYAQTLRHGFLNFDDDQYVVNNPQVRAGLTAPGVLWAFTTRHSYNWHPATWLSHMLDAHLYGMRAWGHHLTNVLLHAANSVLLFLVLFRMTRAPWRSALTAAFFAMHPLHVESVAWIAERKDVLSSFFAMLTLGAYAHYAARPDWRRYAPIVPLFALGLLSKPMLVTLPCLLLLLDFWPLDRYAEANSRAAFRMRFRRLFLEKLPLFAMVLFSCMATLIAQGRGGAIVGRDIIPLSARLANAMAAYVVYLLKTAWPHPLSAFYSYPEGVRPAWQIAGSLIVLSGITYGVWRCRKPAPYLLVGWLWYLGALVPVIGIVQVGSQAYADRYMYLPHIGIFIMAAWGLAACCRRPAVRWAAIPAVCVALAACGAATFFQTRYWRDSATLFQHALATGNDGAIVRSNLAMGLDEQGRRDEALHHLREALRLNPDAVNVLSNLGKTLGDRNELDEARAHLEKAVQRDPKHADARNNLGGILLKQGRVAEALSHLREAVALAPASAGSRNNLGLALQQTGQVDEARAQFEKAIACEPESPNAYNNLGRLCFAQGDAGSAADWFRRAIAAAPRDASAYANLGSLMLKAGRRDEALRHFETAVLLAPGDAGMQASLAAARLQGLSREDAIRQCADAVARNPRDATAQAALGRLLAEGGDPGAALSHLQEAVRLAPHDAAARGNLGAALMQLNRYGEARPELEEALRLNPHDAGAHNNLGGLLAMQGEHAKAKSHFQEAVRLNPGDANAQRNLSNIMRELGQTGAS